MWKLAFFALFLGASFSVAAGKNCYDCSWNATVTDRSCVDDPTSVGKVDCGEGFCITARGVYGSMSMLVLFLRGCSPTEINQEIVESGVTVLISSCSNDLCNDGDGTATTGTGTAATTTTTEDSGASSLTGMLSATFIGVAVALKQVL